MHTTPLLSEAGLFTKAGLQKKFYIHSNKIDRVAYMIG